MSNIIGNINSLLEPVLFQVIGTTPESLMESVKKANLEGKVNEGSQLAAVSVFAAAVNKQVLNEFLMKTELSAVRGAVLSQFAIRNQANMTALTLLGHCLYLTRFAAQINFATEFRKKMGQNSIWDGELTTGSLSETQRKILQEKAKSINKRSAALFAKGYFKFIGADTSAWTSEEATFWDMQHRAPAPTPPANASAAASPVRTPPKQTAPRPAATQSPPARDVSIEVPDLGSVVVPRTAYEYYMAVNNNDFRRLYASIGKNGRDEWVRRYEELARTDTDKRGASGTGTVIG